MGEKIAYVFGLVMGINLYKVTQIWRATPF
jgi:hypothetical protein